MSRLSLTLDFLAYDAPNTTNDPADAIRIKRTVEETSVTEVSRNFPRQVPDATVDLDVPLPDSTTDYLLILTDQAISVKLNGSATPQILRPKTTGVKTPVLMIRGDITSLKISNSSGSTAKVDLIAVNI